MPAAAVGFSNPVAQELILSDTLYVDDSIFASNHNKVDGAFVRAEHYRSALLDNRFGNLLKRHRLELVRFSVAAPDSTRLLIWRTRLHYAELVQNLFYPPRVRLASRAHNELFRAAAAFEAISIVN